MGSCHAAGFLIFVHAPDEWRNSPTIPLYKGKGEHCIVWKVQGVEIVGAWHAGLGKSTK